MVERRIDEVIAFAELERLIDQKIKYYSTGQTNRFAVSVLLNLEPEILLADSGPSRSATASSANGASRGRRTCSTGGGTLVFATHDLRMVRALCDTAVWLEGGRIRAVGGAGEIADAYGETIAAAKRHRAGSRRRTDRGDRDGDRPEPPGHRPSQGGHLRARDAAERRPVRHERRPDRDDCASTRTRCSRSSSRP